MRSLGRSGRSAGWMWRASDVVGRSKHDAGRSGHWRFEWSGAGRRRKAGAARVAGGGGSAAGGGAAADGGAGGEGGGEASGLAASVRHRRCGGGGRDGG